MCQAAVVLKKQGHGYKEISRLLSCQDSGLYIQLEKRGLLEADFLENNQKKWDKLCQQAAIIRKEHRFSYTQIALQLNCSNATLQQQLKKRGLYRKFHKDIKQEDYT